MRARRRSGWFLPPATTAPDPPHGTFASIWRVVSLIPRGRVATYGQVARMSGLAGGARTVGWAMRALPDTLTINGRRVPWHRVINAQGGISLRADPGGGGERQVRLLRREGVPLGPGGRVDLASYLWDGVRVPARQTPGRARRPRRGRA